MTEEGRKGNWGSVDGARGMPLLFHREIHVENLGVSICGHIVLLTTMCKCAREYVCLCVCASVCM